MQGEETGLNEILPETNPEKAQKNENNDESEKMEKKP
jgi:hypothetical protein